MRRTWSGISPALRERHRSRLFGVDGFHLAQLNVALPREPIDSPLLAEFVVLLEPVNALADAAPGFVWRLQTEAGDATAVKAAEDERLIVNLTVWESLDALWRFVYEGRHLEVMRRRREWFERIQIHLVLWWVPAGHVPSVVEAEERLALLRARGPTPEAFTFKRAFSPVGVEALAGLPAELPLGDQVA